MGAHRAPAGGPRWRPDDVRPRRRRAGGAIVLDDPLRADAPGPSGRCAAAASTGGDGHRRPRRRRRDRRRRDRRRRVLAERTPQEKVDAVEEAGRHGSTIMVGDGINDAPGARAGGRRRRGRARGSTASSEAADVVLTVDRLDRLAEASRSPADPGDRSPERDRRNGALGRRDGGRRLRLPAPGPGGAPAGGHRRRCHPQRTPRADTGPERVRRLDEAGLGARPPFQRRAPVAATRARPAPCCRRCSRRR